MSIPTLKGISISLFLLISVAALADSPDINRQGQWKIFEIDATDSASSPAIAIGPENVIYVSYIGDGRLKCLSNRLGYRTTDDIAAVNAPGAWGVDQSLALDADGHAHIVFLHLDGGEFSIRYTTDESGTWTEPEQVFQSSRGCWTPSVGVGSDGEIRIVFIETSGNTRPSWLIYAHGTPGNWEIDSIAYGASDCSALALDRDNHAHVAYYSGGRVYYLTNAPDGIWQAADNFDWLGGQLEAMKLDIAVDTAGQPHISYVGQALEDNKYAVKSNGSWETVTLDSGGFSSAGNAITVDRTGHAHICYYHVPSGLIKYASNESGSWVIDTIYLGSWMTIPVSIATDTCNYPHVCTDDNVHATTAPMPEITFRPNGLDFDSVDVGSFTVDTLYLVNTGDADLVISAMEMTGDHRGDFTWSGSCDPIAPGDSCALAVTFAPESVDLRWAYLRVYSNAFNSGRVGLSGVGRAIYAAWAQTIGETNMDVRSASCIRPTLDGGFIVAGWLRNSSTPEDEVDAWVLKLNPYGFIDWQKTYGTTLGSEYAASIRQTRDGGYALVGGFGMSNHVAPSDSTGIWFVKLDSLGDAEWQRQYRGDDVDNANFGGADLEQTPDSGFIVTGLNGGILKLDKEGTIEWQQIFKSHSQYITADYKICSVSPTADSGYMLAQTCNINVVSGQADPRNETICFTKLDLNGDVQWHYYFSIGGARDCRIREVPGGGYLAVLYYTTWEPRIRLLRLDASGGKVWCKTVSQLPDVPVSLTVADDGGCMVITTSAVARFDSDGSPLWSSLIAGPMPFLRSAAPTADRGIVLAGDWIYIEQEGWEYVHKAQDMLLVRLDSIGVIPECDLIGAGSCSTAEIACELRDTVIAAEDLTLQTYETFATAQTTMVGERFRCSQDPVPDADGDGAVDIEEMGPAGTDPNFDGNGDGLPDGHQNNVASFVFLNGEYGTLALDEGAILEDVVVLAVLEDVPYEPMGADFLYDFLSFTVSGIGPGGSVTASLYFPEGASFDRYYKMGPTAELAEPHWYDFSYDGTTGAELNGNIITLHLVDGLRGDDDLTADGVIHEPGGPAKQVIVDVTDNPDRSLPVLYQISQNYPNPFNPFTRILYTIQRRSHVTITIVNILGQSVRTLVDEEKPAGDYTVDWDGTDDRGRAVATGVYLCRFVADGYRETKKMLLLK